MITICIITSNIYAFSALPSATLSICLLMLQIDSSKEPYSTKSIVQFPFGHTLPAHEGV